MLNRLEVHHNHLTHTEVSSAAKLTRRLTVNSPSFDFFRIDSIPLIATAGRRNAYRTSSVFSKFFPHLHAPFFAPSVCDPSTLLDHSVLLPKVTFSASPCYEPAALSHQDLP